MTAREELLDLIQWVPSFHSTQTMGVMITLLGTFEREARNAAYERAMQIIDYMKCGANENDHASDIAHDKICDSAIKEIRALKETL